LRASGKSFLRDGRKETAPKMKGLAELRQKLLMSFRLIPTGILQLGIRFLLAAVGVGQTAAPLISGQSCRRSCSCIVHPQAIGKDLGTGVGCEGRQLELK